MGLYIRLHDITAPSNFTLLYKTGPTPGDVNSGFTYYGNYSAGTTQIVLSDSFLLFDTQYWFKIQYTGTTGDVLYYIENIKTHDSKYYDCYDRVDFYTELTGNLCESTMENNVFAGVLRLYDNVSGVSQWGNNTSGTYNIYTGTTYNLSTASLVASNVNEAGRLIYTFPIIFTPKSFYVFVEHYDGHNIAASNKRQGAYEVKHVDVRSN